jgi:hypothetical protein
VVTRIADAHFFPGFTSCPLDRTRCSPRQPVSRRQTKAIDHKWREKERVYPMAATQKREFVGARHELVFITSAGWVPLRDIEYGEHRLPLVGGGA